MEFIAPNILENRGKSKRKKTPKTMHFDVFNYEKEREKEWNMIVIRPVHFIKAPEK